MIVLETLVVAFSMFSAIPMPQITWNGRNMRWSLCAFPFIGVLIAACCWGWELLSARFGLTGILRGAGLCLLPVLITGGIHLDGYADTCDALASRADPEKKQQILKDPHLGAFAAIRLCVYFTASLALWTSVGRLRFPILMGLFCLSRSLSGLSLTCFPLREGSGLARTFAEAADRVRVRRVLLVLTVVLAAELILLRAGETVAAAAAVFLIYRRMCVRQFGGLSGDLAGWFLQTAEFWMLAALVLRQIAGTVL